jgi:hypothetical protein
MQLPTNQEKREARRATPGIEACKRELEAGAASSESRPDLVVWISSVNPWFNTLSVRSIVAVRSPDNRSTPEETGSAEWADQQAIGPYAPLAFIQRNMEI